MGVDEGNVLLIVMGGVERYKLTSILRCCL